MFRAFLATVLLVGLVACSPGGAPGGGEPTANVSGFWVVQGGNSFYELEQSGTQVSGEFYLTFGNEDLATAQYVHECGDLSGQVSGRTLTLKAVRTIENCPTEIIDADVKVTLIITGQVQGDSFSGNLSFTETSLAGGENGRVHDSVGQRSRERSESGFRVAIPSIRVVID